MTAYFIPDAGQIIQGHMIVFRQGRLGGQVISGIG